MASASEAPVMRMSAPFRLACAAVAGWHAYDQQVARVLAKYAARNEVAAIVHDSVLCASADVARRLTAELTAIRVEHLPAP